MAVCVTSNRICVPPTGWSWECLQDWGPFFRLAIPSMLMLCIEWWAYEIGSFLVGTWDGAVWGDSSPRQVVHPPGRALCQTVSFQQEGLGPAQPSLGLAQSGHLSMIFSQRWSEMELVQPEHLELINGLRTESKQPGLEWPQETFQSTPDPIYR